MPEAKSERHGVLKKATCGPGIDIVLFCTEGRLKSATSSELQPIYLVLRERRSNRIAVNLPGWRNYGESHMCQFGRCFDS